ncbi:MAG: DUF4340 domain-containing protein [Planctomycetaceae bacterium]
MTEINRTVTFVAAAGVLAVAAWFLTPSVERTPAELAGAREGQEFFPDFDPNEATSIRVAAFDEARAARKPFAVELKDGLWKIPSHYDYPADGAKQLAKTAASMRGIKRTKFKSGNVDDHENLGVVDPLDEDDKKLKGRGQRITLLKGDATLVDLIVGKPVRDQPGYNYVRVPSEKSTYTTRLDVNLSTKFKDWVETDLLKLNRDDLLQVTIDDYKFDSARRQPIDAEVATLARAKSGDPWKLDGLDEKAEELDMAKVNDLVNTLDELKLAGVRPKPKGINADLSIDREYVKNQLQADLLVEDLRSRGFEIGPDRTQKGPRLYARGGELAAATGKGVVYTMRFGDSFAGDEEQIEIGGGDARKADDKEQPADDEEQDGKAANAAGKQSSRYLMVSVHFDEQHLGARPVKPAPPEGLPADMAAEVEKKFEKKAAKARARSRSGGRSSRDKPGAPQEEAPQEEKEGKEEECGPGPVVAADDADSDQADADDADSKNDGEAAGKDKDSAPPDDERPSVDELKKNFQVLYEKYDADLRAYETKVKEGEDKVEELNVRFGDWYYLISADDYKKLHAPRKDLVKAKAATTDAKKTNAPIGAAPSSEPAADDVADEQPDETDDSEKSTSQ